MVWSPWLLGGCLSSQLIFLFPNQQPETQQLLEFFYRDPPTKNVINLVVTGILGGGTTQYISPKQPNQGPFPNLCTDFFSKKPNNSLGFQPPWQNNGWKKYNHHCWTLRVLIIQIGEKTHYFNGGFEPRELFMSLLLEGVLGPSVWRFSRWAGGRWRLKYF